MTVFKGGYHRVWLMITMALVLGLLIFALNAFIVSAKASQQTSFTRVVLVSPVTAQGIPLSGLHVVSSISGTCDFGSLMVDVPAYRCFGGNRVFDPCWAINNGHGQSQQVMCRSYPWSHDVEVLRAPGVTLVPVSAAKPVLDHPFGVQLAGGQDCYRIEGAVDTFEGLPQEFACVNSGLSLFGSPNRAKPTWTLLAASLEKSGLGYASPRTVHVRTAWIAWP